MQGKDKQYIIFLVQLAYVPMSIKNYGLSLIPSVSYTEFLAWSFIVGCPYSFYWAWIGHGARSLLAHSEDDSASQGREGSIVSKVMLMIGGASMFAILFLVGRAAKAEVEKYERAAELSFDEQQHNGSLPLESQNHSALLSGTSMHPKPMT